MSQTHRDVAQLVSVAQLYQVIESLTDSVTSQVEANASLATGSPTRPAAIAKLPCRLDLLAPCCPVAIMQLHDHLYKKVSAMDSCYNAVVPQNCTGNCRCHVSAPLL